MVVRVRLRSTVVSAICVTIALAGCQWQWEHRVKNPLSTDTKRDDYHVPISCSISVQNDDVTTEGDESVCIVASPFRHTTTYEDYSVTTTKYNVDWVDVGLISGGLVALLLAVPEDQWKKADTWQNPMLYLIVGGGGWMVANAVDKYQRVDSTETSHTYPEESGLVAGRQVFLRRAGRRSAPIYLGNLDNGGRLYISTNSRFRELGFASPRELWDCLVGVEGDVYVESIDGSECGCAHASN